MATASTSTVTEQALYNLPLQTDERTRGGYLQTDFATLTAERQDISPKNRSRYDRLPGRASRLDRCERNLEHEWESRFADDVRWNW